MSIAIDTICLQCHMERNLQLARTLGTEEEAMAFAKDLMQMYLTAPEGISSPWFGPRTAELFHQHYGLPIDRYRQEKIDSNKFVLERLDLIRERVQEARDRGMLIDASYGRKTQAVLLMDTDHVILSAVPTETLYARWMERNEEKEEAAE